MSATAPVVWVVAGQHWPRALLRGELLERGLDAVGFADATHALRALSRLPAPRLIVLDLSGTEADEQTARRLRGFGVPVLLITGAAEALRPWVAGVSWAAVLRRPLSIGAIAAAVSSLVGRTRV